MTSNPFMEAAQAAGALALAFDPSDGTLRLDGPFSALGLDDAPASIDALAARLAPGDRKALDALAALAAADRRLRLIGLDGRVRFARLIGRAQDGVWRGLLLPAGASPEGGLARIDLESALRASLECGDIVAHHQPIVALDTRRLAGFEALARWTRPDGEVTRPQDFLPLAAEQGLLAAIGDAVRACAARDAAAFRLAAPAAPGLFVAANAVASEICRPGFAEALLARLDSASLAPSAFKLEISETEVMREPDAAEAALKRLKAAGVSLALDDFGTGYSSLSRLDRFPFDTVKIDQYFVRAALADPAARAIVRSVAAIARSYDMTLVAEGVETEEAAALCADLGCDLGQGYRFAPALRPEDAAAALALGLPDRFGPPGHG